MNAITSISPAGFITGFTTRALDNHFSPFLAEAI